MKKLLLTLAACVGLSFATTAQESETLYTLLSSDQTYSTLESGAAFPDGWSSVESNLPSALSYVWYWNYSYKYLNGSGYKSGSYDVSDAYAISPEIDLTNCSSCSFSFSHAAKFQTTLKDLCGVAVREAGSTEWTALTISTLPEAGAWTFVNSGDIDLSAYDGKKIEIGFKYGSSSTDGCDTWEIKNLIVTGVKSEDNGSDDDNDDAEVASVTFDFANNQYGYTPSSNSVNSSGGYFADGTAISEGAATITIYKNDANGARFWDSGSAITFRLMDKATMELTVGGATITKIEFTGYDLTNMKADAGTLTSGSSKTAQTYEDVNATKVTFTSSGTTQISTMTVYYEGKAAVDTREEAGLSFPEESYSVVIGNEFEAPVLTYATTADIEYSSSNTNVATVDENTGEVNILAVGTTVITASAAENDDYKAGNASYTLVVKEDAIYTLLDANNQETYTATSGVALPEGWVVEENNLPSALTYVWAWKTYNNAGYLNGSGYASGAANAVENAYAISPVLDFTNYENCTMNFEHAAKFQTTLKTLCGLVVRESGSTEWTALEIPTWPEAGYWTFANSGEISLSAYDGKKIEIAFKYGSSTDGADTWEIKNVIIKGEETTTGVAEIAAEEAPVEYYNLQGIKVNNPSNGIYIVRQGSKARKVVL